MIKQQNKAILIIVICSILAVILGFFHHIEWSIFLGAIVVLLWPSKAKNITQQKLILLTLYGLAWLVILRPFPANNLAQTVATPYTQKEGETNLSITYVDVGQAECTIIRLPDGKITMIDAGLNTSKTAIENTLDSLGIHTIDYVILSHGHSDHVGALQGILKDGYIVKNVFISKQPEELTASLTYYQNLLTTLNEQEIPIQEVYAGDVLYENSSVKVEVISPAKDFVSDDLNQYSLMIYLTYGNNEFLFTGDAGVQAEAALQGIYPVDILEIGHHGSLDASSIGFLEQTSPSVGIISAGLNNDYGLPKEDILDRLKDHHIEIYRTDIQGTITIESNGETYSISCEK